MSSINLLPPDIKENIEQRKKNARVLGLLYQAVLLTIIVLGLTAALYLYIGQDTRLANAELEEANKSIEGYGQLEQEARNIAERINSVKSIEAKLNSWDNVVAEVQNVMPNGVYLSKVTLSAENKARGEFSGFALNNEAIANLRDALDDSKYFEYVDIESTSIEVDPKTKKELESFNLTFSLTKEALND